MLGVALLGAGRCQEGGFPQFEPTKLPVVVHVVQYVDSRERVVSPPGARVYGLEAVQQLINQTNDLLIETSIQLELKSLKVNPVDDNYLLLDSFRQW